MATCRGLNVRLGSSQKNSIFKVFQRIALMSHNRGVATVVKNQTCVDEITKDRLDKKIVKYKNHGGIVNPPTVALPEVLVTGVRNYLKDKPVHDLQRHTEAMTNFLWSRKRPVEEEDMRQLAKQYAEELDIADLDEKAVDSMNLPKEIQKKIAAVKRKVHKNLYHWKPITYDEAKGITYLLARLAPNYAATYRVLHEIKRRVPKFKPQAVLDFGSGLGTTIWAVNALWRHKPQQYYCVDTSMDMHTMAESILCGGDREGNAPHVDNVFFRHFLPVGSRMTYDLTVSAFTLLELPSKQERLKAIDTLWKKTDNFLVFIENGTYEGYMALMEVRDYVIGQKQNKDDEIESVTFPGVNTQTGHVFAPCQHHHSCPITQTGSSRRIPCNFEQRFNTLKMTNRGSTESKTERFSYLVLKKGERCDQEAHWPRIVLKEVMPRSGHVACHICCPSGQLETAFVSKAKHGADLFKCARYSRWGDLLPISKPQAEIDSLPISKLQLEPESLESEVDR